MLTPSKPVHRFFSFHLDLSLQVEALMVTPSRRKMMPMAPSSPAVETKLVFSTRTYTPMNNARQPSISGSSTSNAQRAPSRSQIGVRQSEASLPRWPPPTGDKRRHLPGAQPSRGQYRAHVDILQHHEQNPQVHEYHRSFHLGVFQGIISTKEREYII